MAEWQALEHAIGIGRRNIRAFAESAPPPGAFGLQQMALPGVGAQDLPARSDLEAFGHRFLRLNPFRASHK